MRSSDKPASLAELTGKSSGALGLHDLPRLLGDKMPEMPFNRIGKYRLHNALHLRFGPSYRNIPGVSGIIHEFEKNMKTENVVKMNKESRNG